MENTNVLSKLGVPLPWEDDLPLIPEIKPAANFTIGSIIAGRYEVIDIVGGAMGDVYHCHDSRRNTDVALKTIISTGKTNRQRMASFYNEINILLNLPIHPNILTLQRIEVIDGYYYLVTEWVSHEFGTTLSEWLEGCLKSKYDINSSTILAFLQQISAGLVHCHKHLSTTEYSQMYGDIKPENIFVTRNGLFKLGDFSGGYTEGWCAPEILSGTPADERSEIYSLGKVAYEIMKYISDLDSELADCLDTVLLHFTEYAPADRFDSIASLQTELKEICTRFHLESYDESTYLYTVPFKDEFNRISSIMNLGFLPHGVIKNYDQLVHGWKGGQYESIHDFMESVNGTEKKLFTAKLNYMSGKLDEALADLNGTLSSPDLLHLKAMVLYAKGNLEECIHCLLSAILIEDHLPSCDLFVTILLDTPIIASRYQHEACAIMERLGKLPKERFVGYLPYQVMAKFYMTQQNYRMASSYFRRSLEYINPESDWQTLYYYAVCETQLGESHAENARTLLEHTVSLIQTDSKYCQNGYKAAILFYCFFSLGDIENAEELANHLRNDFGFDMSPQLEAMKQKNQFAKNH